MATKILVLGDSGTGKSTSLRNMDESRVFVISCAGKPLPFRNRFEQYKPSYERMTQDVQQLIAQFAETDKDVLVIDDAQYLMSFQYMRRIQEGGWDKFNDIQGDFFNILLDCDYLPDNVVVYILAHTEHTQDGREKIKTIGKMLDEKITIEGLFTTVLKTFVVDGKYYFATQNSGNDTVKSPLGLFPTYAIDNDLAYVDLAIRNYYGIGGEAAPTDEQVHEAETQVAAPDIDKPETEKKPRRKRKAKCDAESEKHDPPVEDEAIIKRERKRRDEQDEKEESQETPAQETQAQATDEARPKRRRRRKSVSEDVQKAVEAVEKYPVSDDEIPIA